MVDLKRQYEKIKNETNEAILNVLESSAFINGPEVQSFARELEQFLGVKHVIPCGNGTDALQVALMSLDLQPGDEIITSDFTFIATVETIALLKLKPVLVDVDPTHFNITAKSIEPAITDKTRAIIPVHLFGQCAPMEDIIALAKKHDLFIIEDTAQATGAQCEITEGQKQFAGTLGNIGCTSFFPSKNLGGYGDGGALFTNDDDRAEKLKSLVNHGMEKRYYHDYIGVNSRLDSIQAAILRIKLRHLNEYNQARQKVAARYDHAFKNLNRIDLPQKGSWTDHIYHQYTVKINEINRNVIREKLAQKSIPSMIYYPVPLHLQKAFASYPFENDNFPVTNALCNMVLSLPMHTELDDHQIQYITENLIDIITNSTL